MNLGDPDWELVDPTPDVYALFKNFDTTFFWSKLASRAVVRWSKRMYSCAGVCSYEGRGGLCDIALSEPLLKLRPRKDLVETLLHEMIHAFLFVTCQDQDRDGHGPNFKSHMYRINKSAGLNISVYHDFHDEVKLYQTHWWRCNGPCQHHRPRFGIVRRTNNRAPGPSDYWWSRHKNMCGGRFIKIKEPENFAKKGAAKINKATSDITKFIVSKNDSGNKPKSVLKDSNYIKTQTNVKAKSNSPNTLVVGKNTAVFNPQVTKTTKPGCSCNGEGYVLSNRKRSATVDVVEQVRSVWANKQLPLTPPAKGKSIIQGTANTPKNKRLKTAHPDTPKKSMNINDYFETNATSVLKDVYGKDFVVRSSNDGKLVAEMKVPTTSNFASGAQKQNSNLRKTDPSVKNLVDCPVCSAKVDKELINKHLDECLNKEVIEKLGKESIPVSAPVNIVTNSNVNQTKDIWKDIPKFDVNNKDIKLEIPESLDLSFVDELLDRKREVKIDFKKIETLCEKNTRRDLNVIKNVHESVPKNVLLDEAFIEIPSKKEFLTRFNNITENDKHDAKTAVVCPCCGKEINTSIDLHLEECLSFFNNNNTAPSEGANDIDIIVLDEDDEFDETLTLNATGTKSPCPCCFKMIEQDEMNQHLDICLS